ncbi:MAG: N-6 DNA methylase [Patescibacteria group bacterium]|nr:N-6 DNA methylase [Patescibacteria group bacterium]
MQNNIRIPQTGSREIVNMTDVALFFGISTATVRNWVKCGNLRSISSNGYDFYFQEIQKLKNNIENGNIKKLNGRANKSKAERTFVPDEYLNSNINVDTITKIISFIYENKISIKISLFLLALNFLKKENIIKSIDIKNIIFKKEIISNNKQINEELKSWQSKIDSKKIKLEYLFLFNCHLPAQRDILGFIYQSLLAEGKKSKNGSYYTPGFIVNKIVKDYVKIDSKVFDPCCGTGQFLLAFADKIKDPKNIYGIDIDEIAIRIARLNLLVKYKNKNFAPNIVCKNTLFEIGNYNLFNLNDENIRDFDVIATNPPWGVHFSKGDTEQLKNLYPQIKSFESFSYFLKKSIDLLNDRGFISFILPESILNVKTHKDIREMILENTQIKKIFYLNRIFKNVFTPVIRLDLTKCKKSNKKTQIIKENEIYTISQSKWMNNQNFVFNIHANNIDIDIISKVYDIKHINLVKNADWALGIVTGNNKKYIVSEQQNNFEPIYRGKDIEKFILKNPSNYILFTPKKFQQVAPIEKYRAKEKLIYKFISKKLVFAYDDKQKLTLNSANIVIPKLQNYPVKVIAALFNSSLYQFIFQKQFSSIKILRSHIEQMPLPLWNNKILEQIVFFVDEIIAKKSNFEKIDKYIFQQFNFSEKEIARVINFLK